MDSFTNCAITSIRTPGSVCIPRQMLISDSRPAKPLTEEVASLWPASNIHTVINTKVAPMILALPGSGWINRPAEKSKVVDKQRAITGGSMGSRLLPSLPLAHSKPAVIPASFP